MEAIIVEIKARCDQPEKIKSLLTQLGAETKGVDHQVDSYFKVPSGRLKLREGKIENSLIFYERANQSGPKKSEVWLYKPSSDPSLKQVLSKALGIKVVVDKIRQISFIQNVKFHVDEVKGLGSFIEIEAIDETGNVSEEKLLEQCRYYLKLFEVQPNDLIDVSYSDLLLNGQ